MRGKGGNKKVRGGTILPNYVWTLPPGDRFVVPFNSLNQPIRKGGHVLVWFLGDIAMNGDLCPIGEVNWHKIDKAIKLILSRLFGKSLCFLHKRLSIRTEETVQAISPYEATGH